MKNRKNYLKARKKQFKWSQIGYVSKDSICPLCGGKTLVQIDKYDSWACPACGEWLDEACGDPDCPYCSMRPPLKPSIWRMSKPAALDSESAGGATTTSTRQMAWSGTRILFKYRCKLLHAVFCMYWSQESYKYSLYNSWCTYTKWIILLIYWYFLNIWSNLSSMLFCLLIKIIRHIFS